MDELTVIELNDDYKVDKNNVLKKGRSSPFDGETVYGKCLITICNNTIAWEDKNATRNI